MSLITLDPQIEAKKELDRKIAEFNELAAANFKDPTFLNEVAQEITEGIYQGFRSNNWVELLTETVQVPLDGRWRLEEARGLRAFWHARGGWIEESDMWREVVEVLPDTIGFRFRQSHDRLRTNFAETAQTLINLGGQRMAAEINARALKTYQAAAQPSDDNYVPVNGLGVAALQNAIMEVRDASENASVTVIGRSTALQSLVLDLTSNYQFSGFIPQTNESLLSNGSLGSLFGTPIQTIPNYVDAYGRGTVPGNEVYVVDKSAGKTIYFGGAESINNNDTDDWYWNYVVRQDINTVVIRPERFRRIVDSSVPA